MACESKGTSSICLVRGRISQISVKACECEYIWYLSRLVRGWVPKIYVKACEKGVRLISVKEGTLGICQGL